MLSNDLRDQDLSIVSFGLLLNTRLFGVFGAPSPLEPMCDKALYVDYFCPSFLSG